MASMSKTFIVSESHRSTDELNKCTESSSNGQRAEYARNIAISDQQPMHSSDNNVPEKYKDILKKSLVIKLIKCDSKDFDEKRAMKYQFNKRYGNILTLKS